LPGPDDDVQVPRRAPGVAGVPLPRQPELEAVRGAGGDLHMEGGGRLHPARPAARRARRLREPAPPLALRARRDADELGEAAALAPGHLPLAVALGARDELAVPRPRPAACVARGRPGETDLLAGAVD